MLHIRECEKYSRDYEGNTLNEIREICFAGGGRRREKAEVTFPEWSVNLSGKVT